MLVYEDVQAAVVGRGRSRKFGRQSAVGGYLPGCEVLAMTFALLDLDRNVPLRADLVASTTQRLSALYAHLGTVYLSIFIWTEAGFDTLEVHEDC